MIKVRMVRCAAQCLRRVWMMGVVVSGGRAARRGSVICPERDALAGCSFASVAEAVAGMID